MCAHARPLFCLTRHESTDVVLGQPLCLDCYDHNGQVVWNASAGELWRRTCIATTRAVRRMAKARGVDPKMVKVAYGKVAEMQRRGVMHFHAIIRIDGADPDNPDAVLSPLAQLGVLDLVDAVTLAAGQTTFTAPPHPTQPDGWPIAWGAKGLEVRPVTMSAGGEVTDSMVAAYLAKYATKSTEDAGHLSHRLTPETIDVYANPEGTHVERLIHACWSLGANVPGLRPSEQADRPYARLRRWAHMLGFGGHFLTKSRRYSVTFRILREARTVWRRFEQASPGVDAIPGEENTLVVNFLDFAGSGWHTNGDALLANSAAARAREYARTAREEMAAFRY